MASARRRPDGAHIAAQLELLSVADTEEPHHRGMAAHALDGRVGSTLTLGLERALTPRSAR
jgi:hypothetical protein